MFAPAIEAGRRGGEEKKRGETKNPCLLWKQYASLLRNQPMAAAFVPAKSVHCAIALADGTEEAGADITTYVLTCVTNCDSSRLVVALSNFNIHIYDRQSLAVCGKLCGHASRINDLACSKQSPAFLCSASDGGEIIAWDMMTGASLFSLRLPGKVVLVFIL